MAIGNRLTAEQRNQRRNFVIDLLSKPINRSQLTQLVMAQFGVSRRTACDIYREAIDDTIERDPNEQRRNRQVLLQQFYYQAECAQADIDSLQRLIDRLNQDSEPRLPTISNMICEKSRIRSHLVRTLSEIARIYGLYTDMPLLQAISVLANSEMLPPEIAGQMLTAIEDMTSTIEKSMRQSNSMADTAD